MGLHQRAQHGVVPSLEGFSLVARGVTKRLPELELFSSQDVAMYADDDVSFCLIQVRSDPIVHSPTLSRVQAGAVRSAGHTGLWPVLVPQFSLRIW